MGFLEVQLYVVFFRVDIYLRVYYEIMVQKKFICLDFIVFVVSKIVIIFGFIFDKLQVFVQEYDGFYRCL